MITTLLLDTLLVLSILWTVLGIAYTYDRWRGGSVQGQNESPHSEVAAGKEKEQEGHCLVGKSKGLTSQVIPAVPEASLSEESAEIAPTFAAQNAESEDENAESNELEVDYTQEDIDEEEVLREEILWQDNLVQDVSPTSILTRDLFRLSKWSKQDDSLDEEDESEVKTMLQSLQGTDLLAQYMAELTKQTAAHQKLLQVLRKAEAEEEQEEETVSQLFSSANSAAEAHSLDYYL